ncbi:MAG: hypothetical protein KIT84_01210 [Labilithrix sp.]|nr:hypothetical protein [Labilithrix sp.]MCW5809604.1 hypothetical protein [Labilithrix sp.]
MDNPFERYALDPREGIAAITQRLKELAEDAKDEAERERIRAAWEELTLHPTRRLRAALFAHPETRPPLGRPPMLPRRRAAAAATASAASAAGTELALHGLALHDVAPRTCVELALGSFDPDDDAPPPLDEDRILIP